ncbi:MAG: hypothetical protein FJX74_08130 [Armatimonadetes bacterium]|nr:hypothetical protein [Armatimonadota bacterium]
MTLPHRPIRGALTGLAMLAGLVGLCALGPARPGAPERRTPVRTAAAAKRTPILPSRDLPAAIREAWLDIPAQGSGPDPDEHLTPTAMSSREFDVATPSLNKVVRVAFVTDGVDEWINDFEPAPGDPPGPPNDPNNVPDGVLDRYGLSDNGFNIWLMRHDGTQQIPVTDLPGDERDPAYDPGATVLAFCNNQTGVYQIYTVDIVTKTVRQITTGNGNKTHPTWSAEGSYIAYATDLNGPANRDIHIVHASGVGVPAPLVSTPSDEREPMWSPDGLWILYTRADGGVDHVWRCDSSGGNQEQLTNGGGDPTANDRNPAWRQDGFSTQFAFASDRLTDVTDANREYNIWSVGASGEVGGQTAVLHSNTDVADTRDDVLPAFSPLLTPNAAPIRIFFTSSRMDKVGPPTGTAEPDLWALVVNDTRPPVLEELPTVSNRNPAPGSDVTVYVRPYDGETGMQSVFAWFKDPDSAYEDAQGIDHKIYSGGTQGITDGTEPIHGAPRNCPITWYEELDCERVGSIELFDDGDFATNGDVTAGDGIFSGIWTTPSVPSDFVIDVELTDNQGNFINFDDIYGLSTVTFAPRNNALFVNDYCEGQAFLSQIGFTDRDYAAFPCESYFTLNASGAGAPNTFTDGAYGEDFDLWRIICRGAPDLTVLTYYGPTSETQLTTDLQGLREVPVANRCLFWAAPHCGSGWHADGTIVEASTQALLRNFVDLGGRLSVAGMDIAWALTMEGQVTNSFLTEVLGAGFVSDDSTGGRDFGQDINFGLVGSANGLIAGEIWTNPGDWHWLGGENNGSDALACGPGTDGSEHSPFPDVISAAGSISVLEYSVNGSGVAAVRKEDPQTGSRVVYFAFPFEAISRRYTDTNCATPDRRHKLAHMTLCYLRTGGIQGRVLGTPSLKPLVDPEPIVTVHNPPPGTPGILYAQRCQKDGTFVISGLPPNYYELRATRPGYKIDKPHNISVHGGLAYPTQDFVLTVAQPGAIQGTVTSLATGDPVGGVTITAVDAGDPLAPAIPSVITGADGKYVIPDVPANTDGYDVTADGSTATPPYGSDTQTVQIVPGGTVTQDFQLPAADGTLTVTVKDSATKALLEDATIDAVLNRAVVGTGTTDDTGVATFDVPPGTYELVVDKPGYQQEKVNATVLSAQVTAIEVLMVALPGGSIAGQIVRSSTPDEALGAVTVQVIVGSSIVAQTTSAGDWTYPGGGNPRYNYRIDGVPSGGRVTVQAIKTGFTVTPTSQQAVVNPGAVTYNVNFAVSALHTFPAGLQFISVPFDYSGEDPFDVLGTPAGKQLRLATWDVSLGRYAVYPRAPADRLRLGVAYWMNQPQAQDLVSEGVRATSPYLIPLGVGWNGIGNPFSQSVDFFGLKVRDSLGIVRSIEDAFSEGQLQNGLHGYAAGGYQLKTSLAPYSGYWIRAYQPVSLVVDDPAGTVASAAVAERPAYARPEGGWLAPLEVWSAGCRDAATAFGVAASPERHVVSKPPLPSDAGYVYAAFAPAGGGDPLAVDVRGAGDHAWTLVVRASAAKAPVTVAWPDLSQLPASARPLLTDEATGQTVYMRTRRDYTYRPTEAGPRTLRIEVSESPQGLLAVSGAAATSEAAGVAITYTLSRDAQVSAEVRSIAGRIIARPVMDKPVTAGRVTHLWDARNQSGLAVPAGKYLVTLTARSDDGQQASALVAVNVRR